MERGSRDKAGQALRRIKRILLTAFAGQVCAEWNMMLPSAPILQRNPSNNSAAGVIKIFIRANPPQSVSIRVLFFSSFFPVLRALCGLRVIFLLE
jgi:hypothetical protein